MKKKSLCAVMVISLLALPCSQIFAAIDSETAREAVLTGQLHAAQNYLQKITATLNYGSATATANQAMRNSINGGVSWLQKAQEKNGHFAYEYLPYENAYRNDDNIVRQAGALYILSEVARHAIAEDNQTNETI